MIYDGPLIDIHHHFWDYSMGRHTWLGAPVSSLRIVGDSRYLERDYLPADYAADSAGHHIAASVHVEAHWDRTRDSARPCVEAFGTRAMFAADFPVASKWVSFDVLVKSLKELVSDLDAAIQRAIFHDTAQRVYRIEPAS